MTKQTRVELEIYAEHIEMKPCPFCGGSDLELTNTWTPAFRVECQDCEAGVIGKGDSDEGPVTGSPPCHYSNLVDGHSDALLSEFPANYRKAAVSAVAAWNRRAD